MSMILLKQKGNFEKTTKNLEKMRKADYIRILERYGREGVAALSAATPKDSGLTAESWSYEVRINKYSYTLLWKNSHRVDGVPIAILIQYGHGTRNGGYVEGQDYINPAMRPIFDKMLAEILREVKV